MQNYTTLCRAFFLCFLLIGYTVVTAQLIVIPGHKLSRSTPVGKVVSTRITNKGVAPATFLFAAPGTGRHFATSSGHTQWLLTHIKPSMDTVSRQLALIKAEINFIKSPYFVNRMAPMNAFNSDVPDSLYTRMFSQGASTAWFFGQCGEFWRMFYTHLITTGYFTHTQFRDVNLRQHTTGEVWVGKGWIWIDADPSMPVSSMVPDAKSPNNYTSAATVKNNLGWLKPYRWVSTNGDSVTLTDASPEDYYAHFDTISYSKVYTGKVYSGNSTVTLPVGGSITWSDTIGYIIDRKDAGTIDTITRLSRA